LTKEALQAYPVGKTILLPNTPAGKRMKPLLRALPCLIITALLAGCSWPSFSIPFFGQEEPTAVQTAPEKQATPSASISPEARDKLAEARKYWTESGECIDPARVLPLLDDAIKADPLDPAPYLLRSQALCDLGYLNDAFDDATKAIRLSPTAKAYAVRGFICLKQNHPKGAQRDFEYAVKLDPKEPLIYIYRAAGSFLEGRKGDACDDLEQACTLGRCQPWEKAKKEKVCR
jgi:tetratricopeptide (TPR) repeat protein